MDPKAKITISERQAKDKLEIIEQLKKMPIVQAACQRTGIGRTTYYKWRQNDKDFEKAADEAIREGVSVVNDLAESQLLSAIKDRNMTAIIYWLKNNNPAFAEKLQVTAEINKITEQLTPEQEALIKQALRLADLPDIDANYSKKDESGK
jgi:predicted ArsR family transcriptional regulator